MKKIRVINRIMLCIIFIAILVTGYFLPKPLLTYAKETETVSIENTNVLDDLRGATINGEVFSLADYPYNKDMEPQLISLAEYCYSEKTEQQSNYGLYVYIYNPQGLVFKTEDSRNKIQMAYADRETYVKYTLQFCNYSEQGGYEGLFYKFKVVLEKMQQRNILRELNEKERKYKVSGFELVSGSNLKDYAAETTFTYSGYAKGYGEETTQESTLTCVTSGLKQTLHLDVQSTFFRPQGTNGTSYTKDVLYSVYFSIPNDIIRQYGEMTAVHATWLNAHTMPVFITGNMQVHNALLPYVGKYVNGGNYNAVKDNNSNTDLAYSLIASKYVESASWNDASETLSYLSYNANQNKTASDKDLYYLRYLFYATNGDADTYVLPAEEILKWFETYTENYGGELVNDTYSKALFDEVESKFTDVTIRKDEEYKLTDEMISQDLWQKFIGGGYTVEGAHTYKISAIKSVQDSDFKAKPSETCLGLYIDENDYDKFYAYYQAAKTNDETVYLFRYYQADYTSYEVVEYTKGQGDWTLLQGYTFDYDYVDTNAYFMQQWVQLGFDVIDVTFTLDDVDTVIPVISTPQDITIDGEPPVITTEDEPWWEKILKLLALIVLIVLLPFILWALVFVVKVGIKLCSKIVTLIKNKRRKKEKNKDDET